MSRVTMPAEAIHVCRYITGHRQTGRAIPHPAGSKAAGPWVDGFGCPFPTRRPLAGLRFVRPRRAQPTSATSLPTASRTLADNSAWSAGAVPSNVANGTDSLIDSTTRAPAIPKDLRVSSCAHTPP